MSPRPESAALDVFERERPRLTGVAYRIIGSLADAEDVVQETWIRWAAHNSADVDNPAGWLTTVTSRLALDCLRTQRRRREDYAGSWLPDVVPTARSVEHTVELAESLTLGFLVVLDSLSSSERVAFLLADVFGEPYPVIAEALNKSEAACRQLVSRVRRKVHSRRPNEEPPAPAPATAELLVQLVEFVLTGDEEGALRLLDPDVVLVTDAGPTRRAARRPIVGANQVLRHANNGWRWLGFGTRPTRNELPPLRLVEVNSSPSVVFHLPEGPIVISGEAAERRLTAIWVRLNPDKTVALSDPPPIV